MSPDPRPAVMPVPMRVVRPRRLVLPALAFLAVMLLGACTGDASPSTEVRDCGIEEQQRGIGLNIEGRACLLAAFEAGTPATFESRSTTIEGDPIVRHYTVVSAFEVQIAHDARRDRFGSGKVELLSCPRIVAVDEWNRVMNDEMRAEEVFVEDGCQLIGSR